MYTIFYDGDYLCDIIADNANLADESFNKLIRLLKKNFKEFDDNLIEMIEQ